MSRKLGVSKRPATTVHERTHKDTVAHRYVPGRAYEIGDPAAKLINMVGGGFFNEPKYYKDGSHAADILKELKKEGKISAKNVASLGMEENALELVQTAFAVANGDHPEDLLIIAAWCRDPEKGLKIRYTPQILLAVAAACGISRTPWYAAKIMQRADEIRHVFAAYRHLFSKKKDNRYIGILPANLRKSLGVAIANQTGANLLKYDSTDRPTFGDILLMIKGDDTQKAVRNVLNRSGQKRSPVTKALFDYFVYGRIDSHSPEILKRRREFFVSKKLSEVSAELIKEAGVTWENIVSHFGSTKEVWEMCIPIMGEMALTRNLRNFEQAGISEAAWDQVYAKCSSIKDTKQLPFRFFTADSVTSSTNAKSISDRMLDNACKNLPDLEGVTVVLVDNSGSCTGCPVSGNSKLMVSDAGNILAAIAAKKYGRHTKVGVFGDVCVWVPFSEASSCMTTKKLIDEYARSRRHKEYLGTDPGYAGVGGGTETGLWWGIDDLTKHKVNVARLIIISDMNCYTQNDINCGVNMSKWFGKGGERATIQSMINRYRSTVNKDLWVHAINLNGTGTAQVDPKDKHCQILSGWSEQVFSLVRAAELGEAVAASNDNRKTKGKKEDVAVAVPTIEILRERYKV